MNKRNLLTIGEMSKLTGASIKSLRYYEKINLLKPAYVSSDSGYRYYYLNQCYLVSLIMFCIELDIPLKELSQFIDSRETVDLYALLDYGKKATHKKIKTLEKGLAFMSVFENQLLEQDKFPVGHIYKRVLPEKFYNVIPYNKAFDDSNQYEMSQILIGAANEYEEIEEVEVPEYGYLCEHSPEGVARYLFAEAPGKGAFEYKVIPAGEYLCFQSDFSRIEHTKELFGDYLAGCSSYIAIEAEVYSGNLNFYKPLRELRVFVK